MNRTLFNTVSTETPGFHHSWRCFVKGTCWRFSWDFETMTRFRSFHYSQRRYSQLWTARRSHSTVNIPKRCHRGIHARRMCNIKLATEVHCRGSTILGEMVAISYRDPIVTAHTKESLHSFNAFHIIWLILFQQSSPTIWKKPWVIFQKNALPTLLFVIHRSCPCSQHSRWQCRKLCWCQIVQTSLRYLSIGSTRTVWCGWWYFQPRVSTQSMGYQAVSNSQLQTEQYMRQWPMWSWSFRWFNHSDWRTRLQWRNILHERGVTRKRW